MGAVEFSRHCLNEVLNNGGDVVAVLTLPVENSAFHSDYANLSEIARKHLIPVHDIYNTINSPENIDLITGIQPDVIFVFGWSQLISKEILRIPELGCIGTHPALLPRNRGRHPLIWALVEGMDESGLTFFYMDEGVDSGDILWQKSFPISLEDDAMSLYEKTKVLASGAIQEFLPLLARGNAERRVQNHNKASYWRKRNDEDGELNWSEHTMEIYNLIRGLARPYVGAHTYVGDQRLKVWRARLPKDILPSSKQELKPGTVFNRAETELCVRTGDGHLMVLEHELEGGGSIRANTILGVRS